MNCKSILELFAIVLLSIVCVSVAVWQLTKTTSEEATNATTTATSAEDKGTIFNLGQVLTIRLVMIDDENKMNRNT